MFIVFFRSDLQACKRLFTMKRIHLRPDFIPWIPVDIMSKVDRNAVFRKAGTRTLPIVFIDDKVACLRVCFVSVPVVNMMKHGR